MNRTNVLRRNVLLAGTCAIAVFSGASAWAANITLSNSNCASYELTGAAPNQVLTCVTSAPPSAPGAPSGCSLSASPSVLPVGGGSVTLTASCSGGNAATDFAWNGAGAQSSTTVASQTVSVAASTSFSVTPSNGNGAGNTANAFVTVQVPPPPVGATLSCPGFASTKVIDATIPTPGGYTKYYTSASNTFGSGGTSKSSGFGAQDAVIFRFVMPAGENSLKLQWSETGSGVNGQASGRTAVLSTEACDFAYPSTKGLYSNNFSMQGSVLFDSSTSSSYGKYNLVGGQTYYLNVSNFQSGVNVCVAGSGGTCDMFFTFTNPN